MILAPAIGAYAVAIVGLRRGYFRIAWGTTKMDRKTAPLWFWMQFLAWVISGSVIVGFWSLGLPNLFSHAAP